MYQLSDKNSDVNKFLVIHTNVDKSSRVDKNSGIDNITDSLKKCGIKAGA